MIDIKQIPLYVSDKNAGVTPLHKTTEHFLRFRMRQIIRQHSQFSAQEILDAIFNALKDFRGTVPQSDDSTLVVVKAKRNTRLFVNLK